MQNAVGVDIERDFDLRHAALRGRNVFEIKLPQRFVAARDFALALQNMHGDGGLAVDGGRKNLRRFGRNRRVFGDEFGHHAAFGFDAERKRRDIEQQHIFHIAAQNAALHRRPDGDRLVGVYVAARADPENLLDFFLHPRHPRHAADENDIADLAAFDFRVAQGGAARLDRALDQRLDQRFEFGARDFARQVLGPGSVGGDIRQVNLALLRRRQFDFGFFRRLFEPLQGQHIGFEIDAVFFFEFGDDIVDDGLVEILAAQKSVAVGRQNLELRFAVDRRQLDDRNIESPAAQIVNRDFAVFGVAVEPESERGGGRLVDNPLDFEPGDAPRVFGRLALRIVEIRRHRDDGSLDFSPR